MKTWDVGHPALSMGQTKVLAHFMWKINRSTDQASKFGRISQPFQIHIPIHLDKLYGWSRTIQYSSPTWKSSAFLGDNSPKAKPSSDVATWGDQIYPEILQILYSFYPITIPFTSHIHLYFQLMEVSQAMGVPLVIIHEHIGFPWNSHHPASLGIPHDGLETPIYPAW